MLDCDSLADDSHSEHKIFGFSDSEHFKIKDGKVYYNLPPNSWVNIVKHDMCLDLSIRMEQSLPYFTDYYEEDEVDKNKKQIVIGEKCVCSDIQFSERQYPPIKQQKFRREKKCTIKSKKKQEKNFK